MKLQIALLSGLLFLCCCSSSASYSSGKDENGNISTIRVSKKNVTEKRSLKKFDKLRLDCVADVEFVQDANSAPSIEITGPENVVAVFSCNVDSDGELRLDIKRGFKFEGKMDLDVKVTSPTLSRIYSDGVGSLRVGKLSVPEFTVKNDGVGTIELSDVSADNVTVMNDGVGSVIFSNLTSKMVSVKNDGVGSVKLIGSADKAEFSNDGVGSINAGNFKCRKVVADCDGVGSISCYASERAEYSSDGIGGVNISGGGEVVKK